MMIDIFIPSYHRADNLKTAKYFINMGWNPKKIHVVIDDDADDAKAYEAESKRLGFNLYVFNMNEARTRYDYVHRASKLRRSVGQAKNMIFDIARKLNVEFYMVQDDDTQGYELKRFGSYLRMANYQDIHTVFSLVREFMCKRKIGLFGLSQTGDFIGGYNNKLLRNKVMNTTFVLVKYIYRGSRGGLDEDTSMFVGVMNEGLFTGSLGDGLVLKQRLSVTAEGGLSDVYRESKLLNKALVCPIQFPSAIYADRQEKNGGRLHHRILNKFIAPRLLKWTKRDNIAWDTYPEDIPFTNEPKRAARENDDYETKK